jgi:hypothetical protein
MRVADEDGRDADPPQCPFYRGGVARECVEAVLGGQHLVTFRLNRRDHFVKARPVSPDSVAEHDARFGRHSRTSLQNNYLEVRGGTHHTMECFCGTPTGEIADTTIRGNKKALCMNLSATSICGSGMQSHPKAIKDIPLTFVSPAGEDLFRIEPSEGPMLYPVA